MMRFTVYLIVLTLVLLERRTLYKEETLLFTALPNITSAPTTIKHKEDKYSYLFVSLPILAGNGTSCTAGSKLITYGGVLPACNCATIL